MSIRSGRFWTRSGCSSPTARRRRCSSASDPLMRTVRRFHLVTLGADAWLAIGQKPGPGSIVLVHPNGNEPEGLRRFAADVAHGTIARPLEPLTDAPQ